MANRRNLKKTIDALHSELIMDCLTYSEINKTQDLGKVVEIVNRLMDNRANVFIEINKSTSKMSRQEVKQRYDQICTNVLTTTNAAYEELSKLARN